MPRKELSIGPRKTKPVLPPPTFKYGSNTYVCLAYAKMTGKHFSIEDIRKFTNRYTGDYEVKRSLAVLERNGSIVASSPETWVITPTGVQQIYDFAKRRSELSRND